LIEFPKKKKTKVLTLEFFLFKNIHVGMIHSNVGASGSFTQKPKHEMKLVLPLILVEKQVLIHLIFLSTNVGHKFIFLPLIS
jgi:hypothetical protein